MSTIPHITCEHLLDLHKKEKKEHVVLDIRDHADFETGHIKDSLHIPHKELTTNIETLIPDKASKVIVVVGPTQEKEITSVYAMLREMGYSNTEFLAGGFDQWCEIAPVEIEPDLLEQTPEERGMVGSGEQTDEIDPHTSGDEPIL